MPANLKTATLDRAIVVIDAASGSDTALGLECEHWSVVDDEAEVGVELELDISTLSCR